MSAAVPTVGLAGPTAPTATPSPAVATGIMPVTGPSFADVLTQGAAGIKAPQFSRHALERINRRGIQLSGSTLQRLAGGMARAAGKGSRDAVVFVDNTAFVVSVPNNTVITAVGSEHMREQVFTNIDSAVIA